MPSNCSRSRCGYGPYCPTGRNGSINSHSLSFSWRRVTPAVPAAKHQFDSRISPQRFQLQTGPSWRHRPARSGIVIDDHDVHVVQTWRHVADHLETWHPNRARANVNSRRLIVDLFEAAVAGSEQKIALREALQALAVAYQGHPDYHPSWALREF